MEMRKIFYPGVLLLVTGILFSARPSETTVGGHLKLTLYDYTTGDRAFTDSSGRVQKADGARSAGLTISRFTLLVMREFKEMFTV